MDEWSSSLSWIWLATSAVNTASKRGSIANANTDTDSVNV